MSDTNNNNNNDKNGDEILSRNVGELLRRGHKPPRIDEQASARILAALESSLPAAGEEAQPRGLRGALASLFDGVFARPLRAALIAGSLAAAVVVGGIAINRSLDRDITAPRFEPKEFVNTGVAPQRVTLSDGSELILRAGAAIATTSPRSLEIRGGDVLFDIAKTGAAFVVTRPDSDARVVVLGTRFVLGATREALTAAVIRGSVRLEAGDGELVLGAGEGAEARGDARPERVPIPRLSHLVSWSRGARARSEGTEVGPIRRGNLVARFPNIDWADDFPLPVRNYSVDIHLENQVARVAIDQTFFNEHPSDLEGLYSFSLPAGAAVSRLAMYVNGELMEAGIAERERARQVYESIVYRRRDPALMEWMAGNEVKVRIFPLFGRQEKRILLSYTQSLERLYDDLELTVPLPRLESPVGTLRMHAKLLGCANCEVGSTSHTIETRRDGDDLVVEFSAQKFLIEDDLLLTIRNPAAAARVVSAPDGDGNLLLVRAAPEVGVDSLAPQRPRRWVILTDTSASRKPIERAAQVHVMDRLLEELDETDEVALVAFDATVRMMEDGAFSSVSNIDRKAAHDFADSEGRGGVGFTDLEKGLAAAAELLAKAPGAGSFEPMIIYLGDGVATGGGRTPAALVKAIDGRATVVAVAIGETHDERAMAALAGETGGYAAFLNPGQDLDWRVFDLVAALHGDRITSLEATLVGSDAPVYLSTRQLAAGEEVSIAARTGAELPGSLTLRGIRGGKRWEMDVPLEGGAILSADSYLPRLWARERIRALLEAEGLGQGIDHREEIVALAMKNWLLTPYTSLLVLESDADYKRFKVARSTMAGWAGYQVPPKIEVVREPLTAGIDLGAADIGALIFRSPLELFAGQSDSWNYQQSRRGWGNIESGQFGFIGRGNGTGAGFGVSLGSGGKDGDLQPSRERAKHEAAPEDAWDDDANAPPEGSARAFESIVINGVGGLGVRGATTQSGPTAKRGFLGNARQPAFGAGESISPTRLAYSGDPGFDDLTSMVPAMFSGDLDRQRAQLLHERATKKRGPEGAADKGDAATQAARNRASSMIEEARERATGRRYTGSDGRVIEVDADGGFRITRKTALGLAEHLRYDGEALVTSYPELDLAVRRDIGDFEATLLEAELPFLLARAAKLGQFYALRADTGDRVTLTAEKNAALEARFDKDGRFAALYQMREGIATLVTSIRWDGAKVVVTRGEDEEVFQVEKLSASSTPDSVEPSVVISMPLRHPSFVQAKLKEHASRSDKQQLAASYVALGLTSETGKLAIEMAAEAPLTVGEIALLSSGLVYLPEADVRRIIPKAAREAELGKYVAAANVFRQRGGLPGLAEAAKSESWMGALATLRLAVAAAGSNATEAARLTRALSARSGALAFVAAHALDAYGRYNDPKTVVETWKALIAAGGEFAEAARVRLALVLPSADKREEAVKLWIEIRDQALAAGQFPPLSYEVRWAFQASPRGEAGWKLYVASVRDRILARRAPDLLIRFLGAAYYAGETADFARMAAAAEAWDLSLEQRARLVGLLNDAGQAEAARRIFEPVISDPDGGWRSNPALVRLASAMAGSRGEHAEAARLFREALSMDDAEVPLAQIRNDYAWLIQLYSQAAMFGDPVARQKALTAMMLAQGEWRALDPDYSGIDSIVSNALFSLGEEVEGMRILSTVIERRPMEGGSFEVVAGVLESRGQVNKAVDLWQRAVSVEPSNPTWSLRLANALSATGQAEKAREVLDRVLARKDWHERFQWIVAQAKETRRQL